jgi:hypothetical protein
MYQIPSSSLTQTLQGLIAHTFTRTLILKIDEVVQAIQDKTLGVQDELGRLIQSINRVKIGTSQFSMLKPRSMK